MPARQRYTDHQLVGVAPLVAALVRSYAERGELVAVTAPRPAGAGLVAVTVRTVTHPAPTRAAVPAVAVWRVRQVRPAVSRTTVVVLVVAAVVVVLLVAGIVLTVWLGSFWLLGLGVLCLAGAAAVARAGRSSRSGRSGRRHCPGC